MISIIYTKIQAPLRCPNPPLIPSSSLFQYATKSLPLYVFLEYLGQILLAKVLYVESAAAGEVDAFEDDGHAHT
jgi:hypothetical protein